MQAEAERAALALAEEGTRLGDHGVSDETWAEVRKHYDGDQVGALVRRWELFNNLRTLTALTAFVVLIVLSLRQPPDHVLRWSRVS